MKITGASLSQSSVRMDFDATYEDGSVAANFHALMTDTQRAQSADQIDAIARAMPNLPPQLPGMTYPPSGPVASASISLSGSSIGFSETKAPPFSASYSGALNDTQLGTVQDALASLASILQ